MSAVFVSDSRARPRWRAVLSRCSVTPSLESGCALDDAGRESIVVKREVTHARYRTGCVVAKTSSLRESPSGVGGLSMTGEPCAGSPLHAVVNAGGTVKRMVAVE